MSKKSKSLYDKVRQLIIIGNGFDLHEGINSSFSSFIHNKYSNLVTFITQLNINDKNKESYSKVLVDKIYKLLFYNNSSYHERWSSELERKFSNKLDTFMSTNLSNFNYWSFCLLLFKNFYDDNNICWYDIEYYLYMSLVNNKYNSKYPFQVKKIYEFLIQLVKYSYVNESDPGEIKVFIRHFKYFPKKYNIEILLSIYFILLDEKYLHENLMYSGDNLSKYIGNSIRSYRTKPNKANSTELFLANSYRTICNKLFIYLRHEIIDFDLSFNDYLFETLHSYGKAAYRRNSYQLMRYILRDFMSLPKKYPTTKLHFSFLNFNYTNPLRDFKIRTHVIRRNIHGTLLAKYINYVDYGNKGNLSTNVITSLKPFRQKKIDHKLNRTLFHFWCYKHDRNIPIIGIDGSGVKVQSHAYEFTKTYGIMRRNSYGSLGLLAPNVKYIKFFGHSLGKADYSYFDDIFDRYHIFNKPIILVFYYAQYIKKDKFGLDHLISDSKASLNQLHSVSKLLEHYCNTKHLDTNSLLSRLLLEGRLVIRNINSIPNK